MRFDVVTVGSAMMDAFVETNLEEKGGIIQVPVGSKILVDDLWYASGGGGTNTAVSFLRLGLKTGFFGRVGNDENSERLLKDLKQEKVKFLGKVVNEPTGYSVVLNSREKNRTIFTFRGANENLSFSELKIGSLKTKWIYLASLTNKSLATQLELAVWARRNGVQLAYNPSNYVILSRKNIVKKILKYCDVLILNEREAADLVGSREIRKIFPKIHGFGPRIACVTYGKKGNKVSDGNFLFSSRPTSVRVVERTGAGDAFASGFIAGLIRFGGDIERSTQLGSANAESVIQKPGAKNGLLLWREVGNNLNRIKVSKKKL